MTIFLTRILLLLAYLLVLYSERVLNIGRLLALYYFKHLKSLYDDIGNFQTR